MTCLNRDYSPYKDWENDLATVMVNSNGTKLTLKPWEMEGVKMVKIKDRVKLDCCLDTNMSGYDINKHQMCPKDWCPDNAKSSCDDVTRDFCSDDNIFGITKNGYTSGVTGDIGSGCYNYCGKNGENGKIRKEDPSHWCYKKVKEYCEKGYKLMGNDEICSFSKNVASGTDLTRPEWVDLRSQYMCGTLKGREESDRIINNGYCRCLNSDEFLAACFGNDCHKDADAFIPSVVSKSGKDCPSCVSTISICAGGKVNIDNIDIQQQCSSVPIKKFYGCDENGMCVLKDGGDEDDKCHGLCQPVKKFYGCDEGGMCVEKVGGEYEDENCSGQCHSAKKFYGCDDGGMCVEKVGGEYEDKNCLGKCQNSPSVPQFNTMVYVVIPIVLVVLIIMVLLLIKLRK